MSHLCVWDVFCVTRLCLRADDMSWKWMLWPNSERVGHMLSKVFCNTISSAGMSIESIISAMSPFKVIFLPRILTQHKGYILLIYSYCEIIFSIKLFFAWNRYKPLKSYLLTWPSFGELEMLGGKSTHNSSFHIKSSSKISSGLISKDWANRSLDVLSLQRQAFRKLSSNSKLFIHERHIISGRWSPFPICNWQA